STGRSRKKPKKAKTSGGEMRKRKSLFRILTQQRERTSKMFWTTREGVMEDEERIKRFNT
ncbi:unnamed protein product, partial [Amoebophrya sp. A120]